MEIGKYDESAKRGQNRSRLTDTAAALLCFHKHKDDWNKNWLNYCQDKIRLSRDELTHYYYAQAMFLRHELHEDAVWTDYRTALFGHLQNSQNKDGSWPAGDGIGVGPVYSTAMWCTILQLDTNCHPSTHWEPRRVK